MYPGKNRCFLNIYNLKMSKYWSNDQYYIPVLRYPIGERQNHGMIRFVNQNGVDATKLLNFTQIFNYSTKHIEL